MHDVRNAWKTVVALTAAAVLAASGCQARDRAGGQADVEVKELTFAITSGCPNPDHGLGERGRPAVEGHAQDHIREGRASRASRSTRRAPSPTSAPAPSTWPGSARAHSTRSA